MKSNEELKQQAEELFEDISGRELKNKDRLNIPPQEMPSQRPEERVKNMNEVALGYYESQVRVESARCLQCKNAPCVDGCPVGIDIPAFIKAAEEGDYQRSVDIIKESSLLPAICGRVCPQETQCQATCTVGKAKKDVLKSVSIGRVERYVADWERATGKTSTPEVGAPTGKKVAVVGSGPASITAAADLRKAGHEVTIFEAFHKPGGVMVYGIPEFRLPKQIVQEEINTLIDMGVKIETSFLIGRTRKLKDLMDKDGFDAIFLGSGAGLPKFMNIEGENLVGVFSANEYLTRSNLMKAYDEEHADTPMYRSKRVAVLGGGNVAMDAARTAKRLGAEHVFLVYRRTEKEMPARIEEVHHAKEEGIEFYVLHNPKRFIGDENQNVKAMELLSYELGEPDESGRRRPVPIEGSESIMEVDTVVVAIGNDSNPLIEQTTEGLETNKWGNIIVNDELESSLDGVFAGGDIVLGASTVILAMGQGRKAAEGINRKLAEQA
ncbi:MAG: NADPH-dependent glutamate synthase [Spirochaetaceae bacterium]